MKRKNENLVLKKLKRIITDYKLLGIYFIFILAFTLIYLVLPINSFSINNELSFSTSFYFSVVTITTLGYGDIFPTSITSKILVSVESIIGIIILGFFISSIFQNKKNKQEKKRILNQLKSTMDMLDFLEEKIFYSIGNKDLRNHNRKERFLYVINSIQYRPGDINITNYLLDDMLWSINYILNDLRFVFYHFDILSDKSINNISSMITNLEDIQRTNPQNEENIDLLGKEGNLFHNIFILFSNANALIDNLNLNKTYEK